VHKIIAVIRREFIERVRTRSFIIGTVLGPLFMAGMILLPAYLAKRETHLRQIVLIDATTGSVGARIETALQAARIGTGDSAGPRYNVSRIVADGRLEQVRDSLIARIGGRDSNALDGIVMLTEAALDSGRVGYLGSNVTSPNDMNALEGVLEPALLEERLLRRQVDPAIVKQASVKLHLETSKVAQGKATGQSGESSFVLAYVMSFTLYFALLLYGIQVMTSVLEEKTNRIVEVLISSLTPFQLMFGKVVGVGATGLLQLSIWAGAGFLLTSNLGSVMGRFGLQAESQTTAHVPAVTLDLLAIFLLFFVLGFFLYAALYAAIGSTCSNQQEAQQANTPVTLFIVCGFMSLFALVNEPSGALARVMTFIPFFAPFVVPIRYSIAPLPPAEVAASAAVMVLALLGVVWVAGRIYRVGILMNGKRPSLAELARWVRAR